MKSDVHNVLSGKGIARPPLIADWGRVGTGVNLRAISSAVGTTDC